ncbi:polysaccharide deacetylase family protein [Halocatena halophila]|uniref:polysaccharide deacetylase family protein n=1 Tax=Halocatena halophila TaxID=2814576 RepID=UPI002ED5F063
MSQATAVLSVDCEWFQHTPAYRGARGSVDSSAVGTEGMSFLLDAFESGDVTSTVFVVGEIAKTHPGLIERIVSAGHEVGSHTQTHAHLDELSSDDHHREVERARETLSAVAGTDVIGFRAPSFAIGDGHFRTLDRAGYTYDSSIAPCRSIPGWYGGSHRRVRPGPASVFTEGAPSSITELPIAVMPGLSLPLTGTWIRFFGVRYTLYGMRLLARRGITPVLYVHPWELVDLPAVEGVPRRVYVRTGSWMRRAVTRLLESRFSFVSMHSLLDD